MIFGLNKNELIIGFLFALPFVFIIGFLALAIAPLTSILWALSGMNGQPKIWRRLGVPFVVCLAVFLLKHHWQAWISLPLAFGALSLGYGIPSEQPPDEGSAIGQFYYNVVFSNERESERLKLSNICTRATIYLLLAVSFLPVLF